MDQCTLRSSNLTIPFASGVHLALGWRNAPRCQEVKPPNIFRARSHLALRFPAEYEVHDMIEVPPVGVQIAVTDSMLIDLVFKGQGHHNLPLHHRVHVRTL